MPGANITVTGGAGSDRINFLGGHDNIADGQGGADTYVVESTSGTGLVNDTGSESDNIIIDYAPTQSDIFAETLSGGSGINLYVTTKEDHANGYLGGLLITNWSTHSYTIFARDGTVFPFP